MFTREESSRLRHEFWTTFGRYMSPIPSAEGEKINWVNYHTRIKGIHFRMDAGRNSAMIGISIEHKDERVQQMYFERFKEFKGLLHEALHEEWVWEPLTTMTDGRTLSRIFKEISGVSVLNKNQWPELISFFKPRIIALDQFWEDARYSFLDLQ